MSIDIIHIIQHKLSTNTAGILVFLRSVKTFWIFEIYVLTAIDSSKSRWSYYYK